MGETTNPKDSTQTAISGKTSEGQTGSTSQQPQTFTREQVDKEISDRLAQAGREAKVLERTKADLEKREQAVKEAEARKAKEEEARELAELEEASKDNPEQIPTLKAFKEKLTARARAVMERETSIAKREAEQAERLAKAEAREFEDAVIGLAEKFQIDEVALAETGLTDLKALEKVASLMPKKAATSKVDSGKTAGGGDVEPSSAKELITQGLKKWK